MLDTTKKTQLSGEQRRYLARNARRMLLVGSMIYGQTSLAFQVVYVSTKNYVIIDAGSLAGLNKGDKVCFHAAEGDQVACGKTLVVRKKLAGVRLPEKAMPSMAIGTEARSTAITVQDAPLPTESEVAKLARAIEKPKQGLKPQPKTAVITKKQHPPYGVASGVGLTYVVTPLLPFVFYVPAYDLDAEIRRSGSLWRRDRKISSAPGGVEAAWVIGLSDTLGMVSGLRWRYVLAESLDGDYVADDPAQYLIGTTRAMAVGGYLEASMAAIDAGPFGLALHLGLDVDRSLVSFNSLREGSASRETVASLESTLVAMAFRLGTHIGYALGPIILLVDSQILVPFYGQATAKGGAHQLKAEISSEQASTSPKDLILAIGHKRATVGVQAGLGLGWRF